LKVHCYFVLILILLLSTSGCRGSLLPYSQQMTSLPPGPICQVAVLPFQSESDFPQAGAISHKVFTAQLRSAGNYLVVQEGDVLKIYQQLRLLPWQPPTPEQLQLLASRLGVQLLISGKVLEMREDPGNQAAVNPVLALEVDIFDGRNGGSLWRTYHRREGTEYRKAMHFGTIHTVTGLSQQVSREIINLWFKEGLTKCDVSPRF
jgi:polysaccharide biosynthesis protein PelC